jgi:hypothetical protein
MGRLAARFPLETPMPDRRSVIRGLVAAGALTLAAGTARSNRPARPRDRGANSIDGAGGTGLLWFEDDAAATRTELEAIRASGMTAVVLTIAPSRRFWMDDAAFEKTKTTMERWRSIADRHPQHLLVVRDSADLARAKREGRLGLIYTFQGAEPLGEDDVRLPIATASQHHDRLPVPRGKGKLDRRNEFRLAWSSMKMRSHRNRACMIGISGLIGRKGACRLGLAKVSKAMGCFDGRMLARGQGMSCTCLWLAIGISQTPASITPPVAHPAHPRMRRRTATGLPATWIRPLRYCRLPRFARQRTSG